MLLYSGEHRGKSSDDMRIESVDCILDSAKLGERVVA
jgi:hypothetical protein